MPGRERPASRREAFGPIDRALNDMGSAVERSSVEASRVWSFPEARVWSGRRHGEVGRRRVPVSPIKTPAQGDCRTMSR
jgi:hypothetical protein